METMDLAKVEPKAPWVGVGKSGNWKSIDDAMSELGLNFEVSKYQSEFHYDTEDKMTFYTTIPGIMATVREDTHEPLGVVSPTYQIVQNADLFSMLQPFVDAGGVVTNGGMTYDGLCFMVVNMEQTNIGGDDYNINIMATNSFNGKYPAAMICSPVRIICQNMYRQLMGNSDNIARFRHSLNVEGKIAAIKAAYDMFNKYKEEFNNEINSLKQLEAKHSIEEFVEIMYPYSNIAPDSSRYQTSIERVDEKRALYINKYYNSSTNSNFGSCFALVNAYYDYISHELPVKKSEDEYAGKRFSGIVGGTAVRPNLMQFMCESR